jgi:hypothetical protein
MRHLGNDSLVTMRFRKVIAVEPDFKCRWEFEHKIRNAVNKGCYGK